MISTLSKHKQVTVLILSIPLLVLIVIASLDHAYGQGVSGDQGLDNAYDHLLENEANQNALDAIEEQLGIVSDALEDELQFGNHRRIQSDIFLDPNALPLPNNIKISTKHHELDGAVKGLVGVFHIDYPDDTPLTIVGVEIDSPESHVYFPEFPLSVDNDITHDEPHHIDGDDHGWLFYSVHTQGHDEGRYPLDIYVEIDDIQYKRSQVIVFHDTTNHTSFENIQYWIDQTFFDDSGKFKLG